MKTRVKAQIGTVNVAENGRRTNNTTSIEFSATKLATFTHNGVTLVQGRINTDRGVTENLYRLDDRRLIIHSTSWSRWYGELWVESLYEVLGEEEDICEKFAGVGSAGTVYQVLSISQALELEGK